MRVPTILCIDDEELGLEIRKIVLERAGYIVLTAKDGASGLAIFNSHEIDAVVVDYAMPDLDGGQVATLMRAEKPDVPILLLSAHVALPDQVKKLVNCWATKGEGTVTLISTIKSMLNPNSGS